MFKRLFLLFFFVSVLVMVFTEVSNAADPNLVGRWKFDETSGDIASDSSGNDIDGTLVGDPQWVPGKLNGALEFDGNGDYVDCGNVPALQIQDQITMACWIKVATFTRNFATILSMGDNSYRLSRGESSLALHMGMNGVTSSPYAWFDGRKTVNDDQWHHVAGVYDGTEARIYIDGEIDTRQVATGQINASGFPLYIGENAQANNRYWNGLIDDVRIYNRAISESEILDVMAGIEDKPEDAVDPSPANKAVGVSRDVILSWTPGVFAASHDVYFGTVSEDVENADASSQLLIGPGISESTFDPGRLEFDQTYYWRVDEVNTLPDSSVYKGKIWSFTVESVAYPIPAESIIATASSQEGDQGAEQTINGSGLTEDRHSVAIEDMWITAPGEPGPAWIQYEFDKSYKLHEMLVWNYNGPFILIGRGFKDVIVEYSIDGDSWLQIDSVSEFAQATGSTTYSYNTTVGFNDVEAKYVRITANSNWNSSFFDQYGLSEVRFMRIPVVAVEPSPENGATDVAINAVLGWNAGRGAVEHNVYLSTDQQAVIDGTVTAATVNQTSYVPAALDLSGTYFWRIDEVNSAETKPVWEGEIWNFTTQDYLVVDDFELYNNIAEGQEGSNLVYLTWTDGYDNPSVNGSTIGYVAGNSLETTLVHSGDLSVPVMYDNSQASLSEVTVNPADLAIGSDWTAGSPETLVLWFFGDPNNAATEQMYMKINGVKVVYPYSDNIAIRRWNQWNIDLASLGVNLGNVTTLTRGFERTGATGGRGTVLFDDIRLYRVAPPIPEPVDPSDTGLVAYYPFNTDASDATGNGYNGTFLDDAVVQGGVLVVDGIDDAVSIPRIGGQDAVFGQVTYSMFIYPTVDQVELAFSGGINTNDWIPGAIHFKLVLGAVNVGINGAGNDLQGNTIVPPNAWSHIALTVSESAMTLYMNGTQEVTRVLDAPLANLILGEAAIGAWNEGGTNVQREFTGQIDEVRIYDRALSEDEILFLADQLL